MKASYHIAVSAGVALGLQSQVHSWPAAAVCFLSGVLIDIDHYLDYYIVKKKFPFNYQELLDFCYYDKAPKIYLFFHGYEYLLALWLIVPFTHFNSVYAGFVLGLTVHVFFDQFTNPIKPLFYFVTYRISQSFMKVKTLSPEHFKRQKLTGKPI